jgi:hypothetical protein
MNATHVDHDALAALRGELTMAAGRRIRRRRSRRRTVAIAVLIALLLAATAATAGLTNFSTGVPVVDELAGIESRLPAPPGVPDERRLDLRPGPGPGTEPLLVPMGDGKYKTVAYLSRDGGICIASAERHRGGVRGSSGGCQPVESVNRRVAHWGAVRGSFTLGLDERTFNVLVSGAVTSVRPLGDGDWTVLMSKPWTPKIEHGRPLRLVVLIDERDYGNPEDGFQMDEIHAIPRSATMIPTMRLTYRDGHTRVARDPHQAK